MLVVALSIGACATDDLGADVRVLGFVTDERSGARLERVSVTFTSDTLDVGSTSTDDDGYYEIDVSTPSPFGRVRAEREGYFPSEASVHFDTASRRVDLLLRPSS